MIHVWQITQEAWNLQKIREIFKEGSDLNLSTETKDESEPLTVLSKIFKPKEENEDKLLRYSKFEQEHIHFAYLSVTTMHTVMEMNSCTKLVITHQRSKKERRAVISIISGTLDVWVVSIINILTAPGGFTPDTCELMWNIMSSLKSRGFGQLFYEYREGRDTNKYYLEKK